METKQIKNYASESLIEASLRMISDEFDRIMWNIHQKEIPNPFYNTGAKFKCDEFEVEAYNWNDDYEQPFNFKWKDIEISWYKYLGRGMIFDKKIPAEKINEMLNSCLQALYKYEKQYS